MEAEGTFGPDFRFNILGNALSSQAALHAQYGGVFPNLAKREHAKNLVPLLAQVVKTEGTTTVDEAALQDLLHREPELLEQLIPFFRTHAKPDIDAITVTHGPGLEPALWVGVNFAKALSLAWNIPIVAVNHMEGHIILSMMNVSDTNSYSSVLQKTSIETRLADFEFPVLALLISGGHTELVLSKEFQKYEIIGQTRDDAAGEAFDKVARLLDLPYPGGPEISRLAAQARKSDEVRPHRIPLPRPMLHEDNFDFSFSGLKTAVRRIVEQHSPLSEEMKLEIAREFEDAVADVLVGKTMRAAEEYGADTIVVGGGVSANARIKELLANRLFNQSAATRLLVPPAELATDNAIMIALAGYFHALKKDFADPTTLSAIGNLQLS
jgi:N6-L-threonylcarbamoyladenine synthase